MMGVVNASSTGWDAGTCPSGGSEASEAQPMPGTRDQTSIKLKMMERSARPRAAEAPFLGARNRLLMQIHLLPGLSCNGQVFRLRFIWNVWCATTIPRGSKAIRDSTPHQLIRFLVERGILTPIPLGRTAPCSPTGAMPRATHQGQWDKYSIAADNSFWIGGGD